MSSTVFKAGKWLLSAATGGAGAWSWAIWLGAGVVATAAGVGWHGGQVDSAVEQANKAGASAVRAEWLAADNAALREGQREVSRLVQVNQEVQRAYNEVLGQLAAADADRADRAGLRSAERAAIVAAASRAAAGTCDRYAALAERHIAGTEADADQMGRLAVRATAGVETLQRTLRERNAVRTRTARPDQPQPENRP